jgi:hypothetical protein
MDSWNKNNIYSPPPGRRPRLAVSQRIAFRVRKQNLGLRPDTVIRAHDSRMTGLYDLPDQQRT